MLLLNSILLSHLLLPSLISAQQLYSQPCPWLGLSYPPLSSYASSSIIQSAMSELKDNLTQALNQSTIYGQIDSPSNAFSVDVYSLADEQPLLNFHHTGDKLAAAHSVGVQTVDSNTVYRIASVSKALTVYIYLIASGDSTWNQPVTNFIPELAAYVSNNEQLLQADKVDLVDWNSVTIGSLATHMSGIAREIAYSPAFEQTLQQTLDLPPFTRNDSANCGNSVLKLPCDRQAFFSQFLTQHPFTSPFTAPIYSNAAFQILGYAIENITGKPMSTLFNETLVHGLSLNSTFYTTPSTQTTSIIPINSSASLWNFNARDESPAGGYYTSTNDMRSIGKSILNSTLTPKSLMHRWLKPAAFTSNPNFSVGAPWEIHRISGEVVSYVYAKSGSYGAYASLIALLPEWNVGVTVFAAGVSASRTVSVLSDLVVDAVVPAVYAASKEAVGLGYAGTYVDSLKKESMVLSLPAQGPGLVVANWTVDGVDVLSRVAVLLGADLAEQRLELSLYPTGLSRGKGSQVSWRAMFRVVPQVLDPGVFSENCVTWASANGVTYDGVGLDEFVFTLGDGVVTAVETRVWGLQMGRVNANGTMVGRSFLGMKMR